MSALCANIEIFAKLTMEKHGAARGAFGP